MAVTEPGRRDAAQHLLDLLIDLLEETEELMRTAVIDLREGRNRADGDGVTGREPRSDC